MEIRFGDYKPRDGEQELKRKVVKAVTHPDYKVYWDLPDGPSVSLIFIRMGGLPRSYHNDRGLY